MALLAVLLVDAGAWWFLYRQGSAVDTRTGASLPRPVLSFVACVVGLALLPAWFLALGALTS